ncbi:MAG: hypothetical protein HOK80_05845, partial [Candidatus Cloacimonetes bacterium]|nr:hypothetical protein [Candidatus Cloacimonadota bacterium]
GSLFKAEDIGKEGLEITRNNENEIFLASKEFLQRLNQEFKYTKEQTILMERYYKEFVPSTELDKIKTPIGISYLEENQSCFLESIRLSS